MVSIPSLIPSDCLYLFFIFYFRTPFHSDVFGSYSWSANIFGRKHWLLLPPNEELKLKDGLGNLPFSISQDLLLKNGVKFFDLIQQCNETLFVPSRWFHQVTNIDDSVSVNHNWFNGCNINIIADCLLTHYDEVEKEIADCQDMENFEEHCQLMLKASFGINFYDFVEIIKHIADKRIKALQDGKKIKSFDSFFIGSNHMLFDLKVILRLTRRLKENLSVCKFDAIVKLIVECENKINKICRIF